MHLANLFFEDSCSQLIQIIIVLGIWLWLWGIVKWWYVILLHWHRQVLLTWFSLSVNNFSPRGWRGIDVTPWTPDQVLEWTIGVWLLYIWHLFISLDDMIMDMFWHDLLMMQADDRLLTRLTYGVEGPHMTTRDIEGEVWTKTLPQRTITLVVARTIG